MERTGKVRIKNDEKEKGGNEKGAKPCNKFVLL